jgi:hypothetical protein
VERESRRAEGSDSRDCNTWHLGGTAAYFCGSGCAGPLAWRIIIYFAQPIAEQLGVKEGDTVRVCGIDLEIAGVFDADAFDQKVITLSGEPLAPLKYSQGMLDAGGRTMADTSAVESFDLDASSSSAELSSSYEHLSSSQFIIVPRSIAVMLPNSSLRSVAIKVDGGETQVKAVSDELARRFAVAMFAGYPDGVRMVAASNLASVSGAGQVAIPLAIAGLIIFNTMMGSIAERFTCTRRWAWRRCTSERCSSPRR